MHRHHNNRDTAIWSSQAAIKEALDKRGMELSEKRREVRVLYNSGNVRCGRLTLVDDDLNYLDFIVTGTSKSTRVNLSEISVLSLFGRSFEL